MTLRNRRQPLIKHKLEGVVVGLYDEGAPPKIWSPMADCLNEPNNLVLVGRRLEMPCCEGVAEECNRPPILMKHYAEAEA